ncbi:MAG: hypothetical protein LCH81_15200 [Bacteroidetes bacterium]|nr:hypothetical protein [Bacteroidota bacterium]
MKSDNFDFTGCLLVLAYILFYIGLPCAIVAIAWKPSLSNVQDYVTANEVGKSIWANDPEAEVCINRNWFSADYYLKSQNKTYIIGNGYYWIIKVSNEKVKEIAQIPELEKCNKIK